MGKTDKIPLNGGAYGSSRQAERVLEEYLPEADAIERARVPWESRATLYALLALLLCAALWAAVSEVDLIVTTRGKLITPDPNILVQPLQTGVVRSIDVRLGQFVRKGQVLGTLDSTFAAADVLELEARHEGLLAQDHRLAAEIGGRQFLMDRPNRETLLQKQIDMEKRAQLEATLKRLQEARGRLEASLANNRAEQKVLRSRVDALLEIETMQQRLVEQQFSSRLRLAEAREKRLEVERDLSLATHREAEILKDLAGNEAERRSVEKEWRRKSAEELVAARRERNSVEQQLSKAKRRSELIELTAPRDAIVLEIASRAVGSVARESEPLFTLAPAGERIEAEVRIDSADVGYIRAGDTARVKIDAFPFQRHGTISGTVFTISADAFVADGRQPSAAPGQVYYVSRLAIRDGSLKAVPADTRLLPGMTLSAEIIVGRRSVLSYLAYPVIRALDESIREP